MLWGCYRSLCVPLRLANRLLLVLFPDANPAVPPGAGKDTLSCVVGHGVQR